MRNISFSKQIISQRRKIQWVSAAGFVVGLGWLHWNLLWILAIGIAFAPFTGKFFCRWICPMGLMMEMMTTGLDADNRAKQDYMYYKLGCPIAWAGGLFNRWSLFKIRVQKDACTHCNACDKACYLPANAPNTSLHKENGQYAAHTYQCSRCGACVAACPTQALSLGTGRAQR